MATNTTLLRHSLFFKGHALDDNTMKFMRQINSCRDGLYMRVGLKLMDSRKILIRFDDFCPTMDWGKWNIAKSILDKYGVKALIGVVPDNKDVKLKKSDAREDYWDYLKEIRDEGHTIAMHGFHHVYDSKCRGMVTYRKKSEFAGHPYSEQEYRIKKGKRYLAEHGIETDIFFAPGHSYDRITLRALRDAGFHYMSDGKHENVISRYGVICVPCKYSIHKEYDRRGLHTVVLHTNLWTEADIKDFDEICAKFKDSICSFEDIAKLKRGTTFIELIKEWVFVRYEHYLFSGLRYVYHKAQGAFYSLAGKG